MLCRQCGTEIAEKALICYRCGTATTEAKFKPAALPARRSSRRLAMVVAIVVALVIALAIFWSGSLAEGRVTRGLAASPRLTTVTCHNRLRGLVCRKSESRTDSRLAARRPRSSGYPAVTVWNVVFDRVLVPPAGDTARGVAVGRNLAAIAPCRLDAAGDQPRLSIGHGLAGGILAVGPSPSRSLHAGASCRPGPRRPDRDPPSQSPPDLRLESGRRA